MTDAITAPTLAGAGADPSAATAPATTTTGGPALVSSDDFTMFLGLLTSQLQNQDPLDPMDTAQFVSQLTGFSQLEQTVRGNDTLDSIKTDLAAQGLRADLGLIGSEVTAASPTVTLADDGASFSFEDVAAGTPVEVAITTPEGAAIHTFRVTAEAGRTDVTWNGQTADGGTAPPGAYRVSLNTVAGEETAALPVTPLTTARIVEIRQSGGESDLVLSSGASIASADIRALREAGS